MIIVNGGSGPKLESRLECRLGAVVDVLALAQEAIAMKRKKIMAPPCDSVQLGATYRKAIVTLAALAALTADAAAREARPVPATEATAPREAGELIGDRVDQ